MLPILQIGPLAIQLPGLLLLLGVWVGTLRAERAARTMQVSPSQLSNMIFYALLAGLLGARLGYVLRFLDLYLQSPLDILALNPNTLSLLEGMVAAAITALVYGQRKQLPFWRTLDALSPGLAVFMVFLGLAHLASGDAFGAESELPWAIELWGTRRHPTQIYEILAAVLSLTVLHRLQRTERFSGFLILAYITMASLSRWVIEPFRGDSLVILEGIRSAQLVSLLLLTGSLIMLHLRARQDQLS